MRYIGDGSPGDLEAARSSVERAAGYWTTDGCGPFSVVRREDGRVVGRAGFLSWDPATWQPGARAEIGEQAVLEVGWMLAPAHWGRGYATEAARACVDWAWRDLRPRRLISLIHADNARSIKVAERLGAMPGETIVTFRGIPATVWEHPE